jgi:hypothetical protein
MLLDAMVKEGCKADGMKRSDYRFTRKDVRAFTHWSDFQVRIHIDRLVSLEYVLIHRGSRGQTMVYEMLYDGRGQDGRPFLLGLIDVEELRKEEKRRLNACTEPVEREKNDSES